MLYALETSRWEIMIGATSIELRLTRIAEEKYNELVPNYDRYELKRVEPNAFREIKYNVLRPRNEPG